MKIFYYKFLIVVTLYSLGWFTYQIVTTESLVYLFLIFWGLLLLPVFWQIHDDLNGEQK